jgi:hypothetical protein
MREKELVREQLAVIASAAQQPFLYGYERENILGKRSSKNCFAALAMTANCSLTNSPFH